MSSECHLDEEGHVADLDTSTLSQRLQLFPQGHQAAEVHLVTVAEVRDLHGCSHGPHHGLLDTCTQQQHISRRATCWSLLGLQLRATTRLEHCRWRPLWTDTDPDPDAL